MAEPSLLQRRPIAVKISDAPAKWTRPQSGLGQADLVYEHVTEGSIMAFGETTPPGGAAADSLTVRYQKFTTIEWRYDSAAGLYRRWADGVEHFDAAQGITPFFFSDIF